MPEMITVLLASEEDAMYVGFPYTEEAGIGYEVEVGLMGLMNLIRMLQGKYGEGLWIAAPTSACLAIAPLTKKS